MKRSIIAFLVCGAAFALTSCAGGYVAMTTTNKIGTKVGIARDRVWFGLGSIDASAATAARQGGITKIATCESFVRAGLFSATYYTKVTGE